MKLKNCLIISLFFVMIFLFTSCTPSVNKIYTVGDTYELLADDGTIEGSVILETAQCLKNSNEQTYILSLTYLIDPNCSLICNNQNVFISCGEKRFNTNIFLNLESNNEIDIFDLNLTKKIRYTFNFEIPISPFFDDLDNSKPGYLGWCIQCYILNAKFEIYTDALYENLSQ
jgi:hypothetical protein